MIPYLPYQRKRFFDFCLEKFQFSHTLHEKQGSAGPGQTGVWENAHDRYGRRAVPRPGDRAVDDMKRFHYLCFTRSRSSACLAEFHDSRLPVR